MRAFKIYGIDVTGKVLSDLDYPNLRSKNLDLSGKVFAVENIRWDKKDGALFQYAIITILLNLDEKLIVRSQSKKSLFHYLKRIENNLPMIVKYVKRGNRDIFVQPTDKDLEEFRTKFKNDIK